MFIQRQRDVLDAWPTAPRVEAGRNLGTVPGRDGFSFILSEHPPMVCPDLPVNYHYPFALAVIDKRLNLTVGIVTLETSDDLPPEESFLCCFYPDKRVIHDLAAATMGREDFVARALPIANRVAQSAVVR